VNPYQAEKLISQHDAELRKLCEHEGRIRQARQGRQARQAHAQQGRSRVIRRRAGWALVSLGLRLAYRAGED
jgi:hypothetical protein